MIEAYGKAHDMEPIEVEVVEGKTNNFDLILKPRPPSLDLYAGQHVFRPAEKVQFDLHGFVEADKVQIRVYKLRFEDVAITCTTPNSRSAERGHPQCAPTDFTRRWLCCSNGRSGACFVS